VRKARPDSEMVLEGLADELVERPVEFLTGSGAVKHETAAAALETTILIAYSAERLLAIGQSWWHISVCERAFERRDCDEMGGLNT
jgi:hypothetical protein